MQRMQRVLRHVLPSFGRTPPRSFLRSVLFAALLLATVGCQYELAGKVIWGSRPGVFAVRSDDPRLNEPGLSDASVQFIIDPQSLSPKPLPVLLSDDTGAFEVPVKEFGAGVLDYRLAVWARLHGFGDLYQQIELPKSGRTLLVVLAEGHRQIERPRTLSDESREDIDRFMGNP